MRPLAIAASLLSMISVANPALAGAACYTPAEFEAEQAIRLHTEMMVVGLTCEPAVGHRSGPSLFAQYKEFTRRNQDQIRKWETTLIGHFRRSGEANPTRRFDGFRTRLANETSQRAIALTPVVFCQSHMPEIARVSALGMDQIRSELVSPTLFRMAAAPACDGPGTTTGGTRKKAAASAKG